MDHGIRRDSNTVRYAPAVLALGLVGLALVYQGRTRNHVAHRPPDSAPGRVSRRDDTRPYARVGRTVTIDKPRSELYAFWRDRSNLARFMENVHSVEEKDGLNHWSIKGPVGVDIHLETRMTEDRPGEMIAWKSTENSDIETTGEIRFRDAPAGRGTEVEAIIAYVPPMGALGRWVAKAFQREPHLQGRRELKRLKMLMETGEIATSVNRTSDA